MEYHVGTTNYWYNFDDDHNKVEHDHEQGHTRGKEKYKIYTDIYQVLHARELSSVQICQSYFPA